MAKLILTDEINPSNTADVLTSGALETNSVYTHYFVNSGTASSWVVSAPCYLHSVNVCTSADLGQLLLGNVANTGCASALNNGVSAGLIAKIDLNKRGTYLFDSLVANVLAYRLTGLDCDGITITYQLA